MPEPFDKRFWKPQEISRLDTLTCFPEMAEIALLILRRMVETGRPITQICGPMSTGGLRSRKNNMELFGRAIDIGTDQGWFIFNQLPFQTAMERLSKHSEDNYCTDILEVFYRPIFEIPIPRRTPFIPRWISSVGSKWERRLVVTLPHITVETYPIDWYNHILRQMKLPHLTLPSLLPG